MQTPCDRKSRTVVGASDKVVIRPTTAGPRSVLAARRLPLLLALSVHIPLLRVIGLVLVIALVH